MAPSPLIVLMKQIGVNQVNVDGLPTYISSTAGGRSVSQIVELPHVEYVGKSRFGILGRLRLPLHLREAEVAEVGEAEARPQWDIQEVSDQTLV
jgi:hypothetical protein